MPRQSRKKSGTGIYHVMLRGINRQDIFEDAEDYLWMVSLLRGLVERMDEKGNPVLPACNIYAYCLMSNHLRLLLPFGRICNPTLVSISICNAIRANMKRLWQQ